MMNKSSNPFRDGSLNALMDLEPPKFRNLLLMKNEKMPRNVTSVSYVCGR